MELIYGLNNLIRIMSKTGMSKPIAKASMYVLFRIGAIGFSLGTAFSTTVDPGNKLARLTCVSSFFSIKYVNTFSLMLKVRVNETIFLSTLGKLCMLLLTVLTWSFK